MQAWARDGVRLNSIAPGLIATPMVVEVRADPVYDKFADSYPTALGRLVPRLASVFASRMKG